MRTLLLVLTAMLMSCAARSRSVKEPDFQEQIRLARLKDDDRLARQATEELREKEERAVRANQNRAAPQVSFGLTVQNRYSESIFTVAAHLPETDERIFPMTERRIPAGGAVALDDAVRGRVEQPVELEVRVMSLGEWHSFVRDIGPPQPGGTCLIVYSWDTATGAFALDASWVRQPAPR